MDGPLAGAGNRLESASEKKYYQVKALLSRIDGERGKMYRVK
jgi:hypothetical protein